MLSKAHIYCKIVGFVVISIIISSCQSSVRFTLDGSKPNKSSDAKKTDNKKDNKNEKSQSSNNDIVSIAESWIGVPYSYGGESKNGVDCSALIQIIYSEFGVELPRTSNEQFVTTNRIDESERNIGDLIFFQKKGNINHVGLYIGENTMIHSSTSKGVTKQSLSDPYFEKNYAGTRRVK